KSKTGAILPQIRDFIGASGIRKLRYKILYPALKTSSRKQRFLDFILASELFNDIINKRKAEKGLLSFFYKESGGHI
ncbi:MAG: hypothetical protein IJN10_01970, partial [Firmicutes bacterium]|nr:hypothetical protein [Bacillota bacterium]